MENHKTLETIDEDATVCRVSKERYPGDKTQEEAVDNTNLSGECSGFTLPLGVAVGEIGGGFDAKSSGTGVSNVKVLNKVVDTENGVEVVECDAEGSRVKGVGNSGISVLKAGSEVNTNEEFAVEKTAMEGSGNGISLFVDVFGPAIGLVQRDETVLGEQVWSGRSSNHVCEGNGDLLLDNGENPNAMVSEIHDPMLGLMQNGTIDAEAKGGGGTDEEEAIYNQECKLSVGDLVWVKTKTQSWWPGLIVDPLYAPKDAAKFDTRAPLLVKYFGNGSCVWCSPLQLKPFIENFEEMSVQGNSITFIGAVKKAVNEFGSRVKLQMTCSCILKENQTTVSALLDSNVRSKDLVLEGKMDRIDEFSVTQFEPLNFLAFIKYLALDVSTPGMLEFAATQNHLSAFYRAMGHRQLPMHQLRGTADVKDSAEDGLKHLGISVDTIIESKVQDLAKLPRAETDMGLEKCTSEFSREEICPRVSRNKEGNEDFEVRNGSAEIADVDNCKLASPAVGEMPKSLMSPNTTESKVSGTANEGGRGEKSGKGYESRERRRSKYLSPPYTDLSFGRKNSPVSEENETGSGKVVSHVGKDINSIAGQSVACPTIVKCSGEKLKKKKTMKAISRHDASGIPGGIDVSSVNMLSDLRFAALNCFHSNKNRHFVEVQRFFSGFRSFVFHDKSNHEMDMLRDSDQMHMLEKLPRGEVPMGEASKPFAATPDTKQNADYHGSVCKDTLEMVQALPSVAPKRRVRKKNIAIITPNIIPAPGFSDVNGNPTNGSFMINFQATGGLAPEGMSVPKKRKKKAGTNVELQQANVVAGLPDLNGRCTTPSSEVEGLQATNLSSSKDKPELKKIKKRDGSASAHFNTKKISFSADSNGNDAKVGSFLKDVQVMGPSSTQDITELNSAEGMKGPSLHLNSKSEVTVNQLDTVGNNAEKSFFGKDLMGLPSPGGKPQPKKRKRKEKAPVLCSPIPDLNGNGAEPSSLTTNLLEMNVSPAGVKPPRKRRRRNKPVVWTPDFKVNHNKVLLYGEALETALVLKFAEGFPVPSKEALVSTFGGFGQIKESETRTLNDSNSAQVVFVNNSDAGGAFRSLEKSSPFGPALINYRLHHLSAASRTMEVGSDLKMPATSQTVDGFKIPANPFGLKPHPGETPDLSVIRKNLEMMTSMLEKAGNDLSPETRAKLEAEVKGLLKKVSTMVGSSSS